MKSTAMKSVWLWQKIIAAGGVATVIAAITHILWLVVLQRESIEPKKIVTSMGSQILAVILVSLLSASMFVPISRLLNMFYMRRIAKKHKIEFGKRYAAQGERIDTIGRSHTFAGEFVLEKRLERIGYEFTIKKDNERVLISKETDFLSFSEDGSRLILRVEYKGSDQEKGSYDYNGIMEIELLDGVPFKLKYYNDRPSAGVITLHESAISTI